MTTPTIVVFGVTGQLGSYVAKALVASYEVRGVTAELNHDQQIKELEDCGIHVQRVAFRFVARGGGTPYTEVYMYVLRKCPCFWPFFSLCPKKKCKCSLFVPHLNLIILSFTEEEISQWKRSARAYLTLIDIR